VCVYVRLRCAFAYLLCLDDVLRKKQQCDSRRRRAWGRGMDTQNVQPPPPRIPDTATRHTQLCPSSGKRGALWVGVGGHPAVVDRPPQRWCCCLVRSLGIAWHHRWILGRLSSASMMTPARSMTKANPTHTIHRSAPNQGGNTMARRSSTPSSSSSSSTAQVLVCGRGVAFWRVHLGSSRIGVSRMGLGLAHEASGPALLRASPKPSPSPSPSHAIDRIESN
jgi:hypothetical protein